jgi:hypothetical protein
MTTYRKFDKYRARTDFATLEEFGFDLPANKWISSGVGTPVAPAVAAGGGITVGTSAANNDSVFIQKGIVSAATRATPLTFIKGRKFAVAAVIAQTAPGAVNTDNFDADIQFGFFTGSATPDTVAGIGFVYDHAARTITSYIGTPGSNPRQFVLDDFDINEHASEDTNNNRAIAIEVYYDGQNKVEFYVGKKRVAGITVNPEDFADGTGVSSLVGAALSPTLGFINGTAAAHTFLIKALGVAIQTYVNRASDDV